MGFGAEGERSHRKQVREQEARHQAYLARLIAQSLTLLSYQADGSLKAHAMQTELIIKLAEARDAARKLADALDAVSERDVNSGFEPGTR